MRTLTIASLALTLAANATTQERFLTSRKSDVELKLTDEMDAFTFAVFGDRTGGPDSGVLILADAVEEVNAVRPDLVMTVGDLVQGYNQTDQWLRQAMEYRGIMDRLVMPWYPVAGNHDVYWRGPNRPPLEHEGNYETHFGPLWYAFEHKDCWFVILYSDETNPTTGRKGFGDPANHKMSEEQFSWLDGVLKKTADAKHVFVFLHHPRWTGGRYGDHWEQVHARLAAAGNVSAVFAGHIHRMRYDGERDGIEYFTLATTGGGQSGIAPRAGYLHHYDLVTVRGDDIAVATVPVGHVFDTRSITGKVSEECARLVREMKPEVSGTIQLDEQFGVATQIEVVLANPVSGAVELDVMPSSTDPRWHSVPDHHHVKLAAGESTKLRFSIHRAAEGLDSALALPVLRMRANYITASARVAIPDWEAPLPVQIGELPEAPRPATERALHIGANGDCAALPNEQLELPDGPFTVEAWANARTFGRRVGLVNKTESSEFGFFLNEGQPRFIAHVGGRYVEAIATDAQLPTDRWFHIAGAYTGSSVRLWVDGELVAEVEGGGERRRNGLPLIIGGDVGRGGISDSPFEGRIDEVRISTGARYTEAAFTPERRHQPDSNTVLLLHMDTAAGPWLIDSSPRRAHPMRRGDARVVDSK